MLQVVKPNVTELELWAPDPAAPLANASRADVALNQDAQQEGLGKPACHWELGCYQAWKHPADSPGKSS